MSRVKCYFFSILTCPVLSRTSVLDRGSDPSTKKGNFWEGRENNVEHYNVYRKCGIGRAKMAEPFVSCRLDVSWRKESCIRRMCTLALPGKYG